MGALNFQYWALVITQLALATATSIMVNKKKNVPLKLHSFNQLSDALKKIKKLIGNYMTFSTINYWSRNADNLLVGKYYGTVDLGIYNRAYMLLTLPLSLISGIFSTVLYPSLVKLKRTGGKVQEEYYFVLKIISLINLPVAIILICFPSLFVKILWGSNWIKVSDLLPYFG